MEDTRKSTAVITLAARFSSSWRLLVNDHGCPKIAKNQTPSKTSSAASNKDMAKGMLAPCGRPLWSYGATKFRQEGSC